MTFDTPITRSGPWRSPRQMLGEQEYDGHTSVHDDETAAKLGLTGAPIEGPTHFSQFDPLAHQLWGDAWFERGCISVHFQTMVIEGEQVRASITPTGDDIASIEAVKPDGTPVLTGTISLGAIDGGVAPVTELDRRLAGLREPGELFIVDRLSVGMSNVDDEPTVMNDGQRNGDLYPFSLADKVAHITEPHPWYTPAGGAESPWGSAVVPFEMISVLAMKSGGGFPVRGPAVGLFLDLEVRVLQGPVLVDRPYRVHREIVGLGQSRKTESYWIRTTLTDAETSVVTATVLLHSGVFKASYAGYPTDRLA